MRSVFRIRPELALITKGNSHYPWKHGGIHTTLDWKRLVLSIG